MENIPSGSFAEGNCVTNEDERSRPNLKEKKAKALAKLKELNKRVALS